mgnify:CR=1 FL=1
MVKFVYPGSTKETWNINLQDISLKAVTVYLKSAYPEGRIIANDNLLDGL